MITLVLHGVVDVRDFGDKQKFYKDHWDLSWWFSGEYLSGFRTALLSLQNHCDKYVIENCHFSGFRIPLFSDSITGEFSPNFTLKNMISTYTKDFSWKEITQLCQILEGKKFQISKLCMYYQAWDRRCILWRNPWWVLGRTVFVGPDRDYHIGSNFWKFYLIRTIFTLDEPVFLVKVFRLCRLERIVLFWCSECGHNEWCTTSYLLARPACLWCLVLRDQSAQAEGILH